MTYLNLDNNEVGFLQDANFRRALMEAIDRDLIIEKVYGGQAIKANGPIMPSTWLITMILRRFLMTRLAPRSSLWLPAPPGMRTLLPM